MNVKKRRWWAMIGLGVALLLGLVVPRYFIDDGLSEVADPEALSSATAAYELAYGTCLDSPFARAIVTGIHVTSVAREEGSCEMFRGAAVPREDYNVTVRAYTAFGLPVRDFHATCGGKHIVCY
jgi:hypothetical protein